MSGSRRAGTIAIGLALTFCLMGCLGGSIAPAENVDTRCALSSADDSWEPGPQSPSALRDGAAWFFPCPFPDEVDRHFWDQNHRLDLEAVDGLEFRYQLDDPGAFRALTWYLRKGRHWWAANLPVGEGVQHVWVPVSEFEPLDQAGRLQAIDGFRLSPWTASRGAGGIQLFGVEARVAELAILMPGSETSPDPGERAFGQRAGRQWSADLSRLSFAHTLVESADEVAALDAARIRVLILPYNPTLSGPMMRALRRFVDRGGALIVCYNANQDLAALMGMRVGRWTSAGRAGRWHAMRFVDETWDGPARVRSSSTPNLLPISPRSEGAEILARWEDASGTIQREAAVVTSPQGAWFSYMPGAEDDYPRLRMVAFLLDRHMPDAALRAVQKMGERRAEAWGGLDSDTPAAERIQPAVNALQNALAGGQAAVAWQAYDELRQQLDLAEAEAEAAPLPEARGIWDHTGQGLYPGNWERTLKELESAGFTDLFVYVPRSAGRPTAVARLAASFSINVHAWHICLKLDGLSADRIRRLDMQGRLQADQEGNTAHWLCPALPENRRMERDRILALAGTPGVGGIHLDYARYPDARHCYGSTCREGFEEELDERIQSWPDDVLEGGPLREAFLTWRARQIDLLVAEISEAVRAQHPDLLLSAAVWPDIATVKPQLGQNWPYWLASNWVDVMTPMSYTQRTQELAAWTQDHVNLPNGDGRIWAGLGVRSSHTRLTPGQTISQIRAAYEVGAAGFVVFDLNASVRDELFPVLRKIMAVDSND